MRLKCRNIGGVDRAGGCGKCFDGVEESVERHIESCFEQ